MKKSYLQSNNGQSALEYLLLCGIVALVVITAFSKNGFMNQVRSTSNVYYEQITNVIMGDDVEPINGGWCEWSLCVKPGTYHFRTCECPAPAFGGAPCPGESSQFCVGGPCAVGEDCRVTFCACPASAPNCSITGECVATLPTCNVGDNCGFCYCPYGQTCNGTICVNATPTPVPVPVSCGDSVCSGTETAVTCPVDCGGGSGSGSGGGGEGGPP